MKYKVGYHVVLLGLVMTSMICSFGAAQTNGSDKTEMLKESLVYIETSVYSYSAFQPWRHTDLSKQVGYGCAVGDHEVLTTAYNVADAAFITVRKFGQNELIPAQVKVVDYESNLCLLELAQNGLDRPLRPIEFHDVYDKGATMEFYWLSEDNRVHSGRGYIDRVEIFRSSVSFARFINYVISNVSQRAGLAHLFFRGDKAVGLGCWYDKGIKESGVIPAVVINQFLTDVREGDYDGFPMVGFDTEPLLDPALRAWLKMTEPMKTGVYVSKVYTLGTGSDMLKQHDVILSINGEAIDAYGRFEHRQFQKISFEHLITSQAVGASLAFEVWRDGKKVSLKIKAQNVQADDMLIPYHEYDRQGEYLVVGGFILQKLTRKYLSAWGENWSGRVDPHLYHYYRESAFIPSEERQDIVILSRVLPAEINLGYQNLKQLVVTKYNGKAIRSMRDMIEAGKLNPEGKFDVIEFENDNPTVVLPRALLPQGNTLISRLYGIEKLQHIEE